MKPHSLTLLLLVILFVCSVARAQSPSDQTIARLKDEVTRREAIDRDDSTPGDLKATNRRILDQRRDELVAAIQARIAAVQKYLETLGPAATEEERTAAARSLSNSSDALAAATPSKDPADPKPVPRVNTTKSVTSASRSTESIRASFLRKPSADGTGAPSDNSDAQPASAATANGDEPKSKIVIEKPESKPGTPFVVENVPSITSYVKVAKDSHINNIQYEVTNGDNVHRSAPIKVGDTASADKELQVELKIIKGNNTIRVFNADKESDLANQATVEVTCNGDNCASDFNVATIPSNSRFTRAVVGIEQAGASSAESKSNPFLDFFFTTPLKFNTKKEEKPVLNSDGSQAIRRDGTPITKWETVGEPAPRFGAWGQVRFSTTPEQTSSFAVFPSSLVNQVSDPTKVVDLVQSFDFLAGLEYRAFDATGWIWTLIPGLKQKTSVYFTFGGGAISPLSVKRASAQLFTIPVDAVPAMGGNPAVPADPRRAEFIRRFGDPKTLKYVGFVPLERDRFFRQYYAGIRLKTHYCGDSDCHTYKNRFPSIVDFGIGQNEAVTGGRLKSDVRDAANNLIGRRRAWVARVDAFFPLPFREANFLYLYGTALMKIGGGGGVRIQTPLFLDTPTSTIQITDPNVYIPPADLQPTRTDRDYYKIGIGVNLTDLFNRNKTKSQ
jgi:hypothetical protein